MKLECNLLTMDIVLVWWIKFDWKDLFKYFLKKILCSSELKLSPDQDYLEEIWETIYLTPEEMQKYFILLYTKTVMAEPVGELKQ